MAVIAFSLISISWLAVWTRRASKSNIAYVTLLAIDKEKAAQEKTPQDMYKDKYFIGVRLLCYQVLHDPETRSRSNAPCIVLTTPEVSQDKIDRLEKDGATVQKVTHPIVPEKYRGPNDWRFLGVWNKLLVFKMTQFKRVIFLDCDTVLLKPMDDILDEPNMKIQKTIKNDSIVRMGNLPPPPSYLFAGSADVYTVKHHWPLIPPEPGKVCGESCITFCAGMFVVRPDIALFDFLMSVLDVPGKFSATLPEQNLMNWAFDRRGTMPMAITDPSWNVRSPNFIDVKGGTHSLHEKWWIIHKNGDRFDHRLEVVMQMWRWRMEGYYLGRDGAEENPASLPGTSLWKLQ